MKYILNERESKALDWSMREYQRRFDKDPATARDLFVHLGDNPWRYLCWSATSQRMPTFRTGSGFIYNPCSDTWLLPKDKLACLGFPVTPSTAMGMRVAMLPIADCLRASTVAGNSFHFCTVAVVQMVALACYQRV